MPREWQNSSIVSDFSGQLLVQVSPFLFTSPSNKKIQAICSGRSRQACYLSTLEEMDCNCVVTKYAYCYFQNFIFQWLL